MPAFKPSGTPMARLPQIPLLREEVEVIRLCDLERLTQEQAGVKMGVSRGTVQRILTIARKKIATALTQGHALILEK